MKNKLFILIVCILGCLSCTTSKTESFDKELVILIDKTDALTVKPDENHIYASLGLNTDMYQGVRITLSTISEKDLNTSETVSLPAESDWLSNKTIREARVAKFKKEFHQKLDSILNNADSIQPHSIVYRSCVRQLELLASRPAKYKALIIYSDLMENDEVSFYDPFIFKSIRYTPRVIQKQLEQLMPLNDLTSINVFLVYSPGSYEDNSRYMSCANFFDRVFKSKHAWVHTEPSF